MVRLKLPPGLTEMSWVNVNHWFPLTPRSLSPLALKLSTFLFSFVSDWNRPENVSSLTSYLPKRKGRGDRWGREERLSISVHERMEIRGRAANDTMWQLMLLIVRRSAASDSTRSCSIQRNRIKDLKKFSFPNQKGADLFSFGDACYGKAIRVWQQGAPRSDAPWTSNHLQLHMTGSVSQSRWKLRVC